MADDDVYRKQFACLCSNKKPYLFIAPFVLVFVLVSILGPTGNFNRRNLKPFSHANESEIRIVDDDLKSRAVVEDTEELLPYSGEPLLEISSPPAPSPAALAVTAEEEVAVNQSEIKKVGLTNSMNLSEQVPPMDELNAFETERKQRRPRMHTNLEKTEAGLWKSRAAIKEAKYGNQTGDPDYVPIGPMYWNAKAFHRSYLEMEKKFKVYVYEEGEPPVFHDGPCRSIYSSEGSFIYEIEKNSQFRTRDPSKAHVYFLPFSVSRLVHYVYVRDSHDMKPIKRTVIDYVNLIAGRYPFWNRSLGADHFMVACHDWGPETTFAIPYLHKNSIRALCNANTSEKFNPTKDVSIPEINLVSYRITNLLGGPSPSRRSTLAFFAGGVHGPVRPIVFEHWENKDEAIKVHKYLPKGVSYYEMMRISKYCLCPSGYEVASPRIVEAIYTGCVPVLISDNYVPPFSDVLNWKSFSVEVPVSEVPNLKRILESISTRQYIKMQRRVLKIRRHFEFHSPPKRFDVFHMILHSIWLRRLNIGIIEHQGDR